MRTGIIDADLLDNGTRHPNLALMKISAFKKEQGNKVELVNDYNHVSDYDEIYISKVFSKTSIPIRLDNPKIKYGGTGFFYDKAPDLPDEIEHHMPDYGLYNSYIQTSIDKGANISHFSDYLFYSIGFSTRGCFRKCSFCVNRKYDKSFKHSPIAEFFDHTRKYIYLWDDNFFSFCGWEQIIDELQEVNRPFQFRQGLDIRLLDKRKAMRLSQSNYHGDVIFAFDVLADEEVVRKGLNIWKDISIKSTKLYLLCAYESTDIEDIYGLFHRIRILMRYGCLPYVMRYDNWRYSKYAGMYITIARWCNQPAIFKKMSFRQFVEANGSTSSAMRYFRWFIGEHPDFPLKYLDMRFEDLNLFK